SLLGGFAVENLPGHRASTDYDSLEEFHTTIDSFLDRHDQSLNRFISDPSSGYHLSNGNHKFVMQGDPKTGEVGSCYYKQASGLKRFAQKQLTWLNPVLSGIKTVAQFIP